MFPNLEEIQKRRKLLNINQKKLAVLAGVSQSLIAKIESGRMKPSYENVKKIFSALEKEEEKKTPRVKARDIHNAEIEGVQKSDTIIKASQIMKKYGYSQLPVYDNNTIVGSISEDDITKYIARGEYLESLTEMHVDEIMSSGFPQIDETSFIEPVTYLLRFSPAVLTTREGKVVGIITKADLFKLLKKS